MTNRGQRTLHASEQGTVPNKGNTYEHNIYKHPDEAPWLSSRLPDSLKQTRVTFRLQFKL